MVCPQHVGAVVRELSDERVGLADRMRWRRFSTVPAKPLFSILFVASSKPLWAVGALEMREVGWDDDGIKMRRGWAGVYRRGVCVLSSASNERT